MTNNYFFVKKAIRYKQLNQYVGCAKDVYIKIYIIKK